jgi:hypothetical protein
VTLEEFDRLWESIKEDGERDARQLDPVSLAVWAGVLAFWLAATALVIWLATR